MFTTQLAGFDVDWTSVLSGTTFQFHPSFLNLAIQHEISVEVFPLGVNGDRGTRVNATVLYGLKQTSNIRVVSIS